LSLDKFVYTGKDNLEAMREAKNYNNYLISNIIKFLPSKNKNILDFGAGSGTYAEMLKDLGYRVDCLEPDMELAKELRSKGFKVFQELEQIKTNSPLNKIRDGVYQSRSTGFEFELEGSTPTELSKSLMYVIRRYVEKFGYREAINKFGDELICMLFLADLHHLSVSV
jgi:SAM-dependent methyltransferase